MAASSFSGKEGKIIDKETADKITSRHEANRGEIEKSGKGFTKSSFIGIEVIKQLLDGVPVKSILGIKIKYGVKDKDGVQYPDTIIEVVTKDKTSKYKAVKTDHDCPLECGSDT